MNEKTRAVVQGEWVDIYYGEQLIGWIEGQVTRLLLTPRHDKFLVQVRKDNRTEIPAGVIVADTIEKGDQ